MKVNKLHIIISVSVLICYFTALTPIHTLWHLLTDEITCVDEEHHHHSADETQKNDCPYCEFVFSEQGKHLFTDTFYIETSLNSDFFQKKLISSKEIVYSSYFLSFLSLRAPPFDFS